MDLMGPDGSQERDEERDEVEQDEERDEERDEEPNEERDEDGGSGEEDGGSGEDDESEDSEEDQAEQPKKRKGRGEAKMAENRPFEDRPKLCVIGERAFSSKPYDSKVVSTIAQLLKRNTKGPYSTYGQFPEDTKNEILRAFLMKYRWASSKKKRQRCCDVFHRIARARYSNILTKVRTDVVKLAQSKDPISWKPFTPRWINRKHWDKLCDYWASPEWQKKSAQMRDNRVNSGVHVYHRQGRANSYALQRTMGEKMKRKVTYAEVYVQTRMKKDKQEFLSERAGTIYEKYCILMNQHYGDNTAQWPDLDTNLWCQASGGKKNGYYCGVPALMDSANLPGGRPKYPVMGNILGNGEQEDYDDDEDEEEDPTYLPPKKKTKRKTSPVPESKKVSPEIFDHSDYEEEIMDLDDVSTDSYESDED